MSNRAYVYVTANSSKKLADAPSFTEEQFHGKKGDSRNKVPKTHEMDQKVVRCVQAIKNWASATFPSKNIVIKITSTKRTQAFQLILKEGGQTKAGVGGPHVLALAVDLVITSGGGPDLEIIKEFNTQIRDKGSAYQKLRKAGMGGIGLYGASKGHFCHVDTRDIDTPSLPRSISDPTNGPYSFWKISNPLFKDSAESDQQEEIEDTLPIQEDVPCTTTFINSTEGLSTGTTLTMQHYISSLTCPFSNNISANDILDYVHEGLSNRERIFNALSLEDRIIWSNNSDGTFDSSVDYPFELGSSFIVPCEFVTISAVKGSNESVQTTGGSANSSPKTANTSDVSKIGATLTSSLTNMSIPYPPILTAVAKDPGYRRTNTIKREYQSFIPQITVYGWSRGLHLAGHDPLINLTPHVMSVTTTSDLKSGGSFSIEMAPIAAKWSGQAWIPIGLYGDENGPNSVGLTATTRTSFTSFEQFEKNNSDQDGSISLITDSTVRTHSDMYFEKVFFQNDMIFIKFESLDIDNNPYGIVQLKDQWYDMMGMIDGADAAYNGSNSVISVMITGRDLQKPLVDESGYYNPYSIGKSGSYFGKYADLISPRSYDGGIYKYKTVEYLTIASSIEFALYALISNEFVPSACFDDNWPWDDLNHLYIDFSNKDASGRKIQKREDETEGNLGAFGLRGVWKKIRLWIDPQVADYVVYDDSISLPEGSIWDHFQKICQQPYVEMLTETIGDWFYIIIRKPPFTQAHLQKLLKSGVDEDTQLYDQASSNEGTSRYKTWKDNINHKLNKSTAENDESLSSSSDIENYQDFYATEESVEEQGKKDARFLSIVEQKNEIDFIRSQYEKFLTETPPILNINALDVSDFSVDMCTDAYSWFEVDTRGMYENTGGPFGMPIPAVYFNEIAQIFGSKRLSVSSNYIDVHTLRSDGANQQKKQTLLEDEIAQLLGYLIETHIHLPFTRQGTITLNVGERRIKKGMYVWYEPTDEIFYVDRVVHQFRTTTSGTIRTTTLSVSRGMVARYIAGVKHVLYDEKYNRYEKVVSYFSIIDLPKIQRLAAQAVNDIDDMLAYDHRKPAPLDKAVLNFFLQKRQFDKEKQQETETNGQAI